MGLFRFIKKNLASFRRLQPYLGIRRRFFLFVLALSLLAGSLEAGAIGLLLPLLSLVQKLEFQPGQTDSNPTPDDHAVLFLDRLEAFFPHRDTAFYILLLCILVLVVILAKNALVFLAGWMSARLKMHVFLNLRESLFRCFQRADLQVFEENQSGKLVNAFMTDTLRCGLCIEHFLKLVQRSSIVLFYFIMMLWLSWKLTALSLLLAVCIALVMGGMYRRLKSYGQQFTQAARTVYSNVLESLQGVRLIRSVNRQNQQIDRCRTYFQTHACLDLTQKKFAALIPCVTESLSILGAMCIIGYASISLVAAGKMSSAVLMAFGLVLVRLLPSANQIYALYGEWVYQYDGLKAMEEWMDLPRHPQTPFGKQKFNGIRNAIQIRNVSFSYNNNQQALTNVSFDIRRGQSVALVGASGSGKTTLANLLLRFRQPTRGQILVDGQNYWDFSPDSWHAKTAIVEQEAFLFHTTLRDNIRFGKEDASEDEIWEAFRMAQLEDLVRSLPHGLDTIVGERGTLLSGGQKQRLAIARALLKQPDFLILDEATSALDSISESQVQTALHNAQLNRSSLVIAHRLSTVRHADHIVVLEAGRIVEQGSWRELETHGVQFNKYLQTASSPNGVPST